MEQFNDSAFLNNTSYENVTSGIALQKITHASPSTVTFTWTFYFSIFIIWIPGTVTNLLALYFIVKDIKKAVFPAIILLLVLCCCDLIAVISSAARHMMGYFVTHVSYAYCAGLSTTHIFFRIASGVLNCMMAVDRLLAICTPFYYKRNVDTRTWKVGCVIAGLAILFYCLFPLIGLGDYMATRGRGTVVCSSLSYRQIPVERVFGIFFGCIGFLCIIVIFVCNMFVIRSLIRLNNRVADLLSVKDRSTSTDESSGSTSTAKVTSFEVAFAKLMGCLAAVYIVCGTPYSVSFKNSQLSYCVFMLNYSRLFRWTMPF